MRRFISLALVVLLIPIKTPADTYSIVNHIIPDAEIVGEGRLTLLFWDVYDATLYAPEGTWNSKKPFALTLSYLRDLEGSDIAERSVEEIQKQGFNDETKLSKWHQEMQDIFPDVRHGTELTGVHIPGRATHFFEDGKKIGTITDPEFGQYFFDIWLGEKTSEPGLRKQLIGLL